LQNGTKKDDWWHGRRKVKEKRKGQEWDIKRVNKLQQAKSRDRPIRNSTTKNFPRLVGKKTNERNPEEGEGMVRVGYGTQGSARSRLVPQSQYTKSKKHELGTAER